MIKEIITGRAFPYVAILVFLLIAIMAGAIWLLMQERDSLNQAVGALDQANKQYTETIQLNATDYDALQAELEHRDAVVSEALQAQQKAERKANDVADRLRQKLQADVCANTFHPDVVADSLRAFTAIDQDQD